MCEIFVALLDGKPHVAALRFANLATDVIEAAGLTLNAVLQLHPRHQRQEAQVALNAFADKYPNDHQAIAGFIKTRETGMSLIILMTILVESKNPLAQYFNAEELEVAARFYR